MNALRMLLVSAALTTFGGAPHVPTSAPSDFAIRLEFGMCSADVIDTFNRVYVRDLGSGNTVSVQIFPSEQEKDDLFRAISRSDFFTYPSDFRPPMTSMTEPAPRYRLTVRAAGQTHSVSWRDFGWNSPRSSVPEAQRLRELIETIQKTFSELPAVKNLPRSEMICL